MESAIRSNLSVSNNNNVSLITNISLRDGKNSSDGIVYMTINDINGIICASGWNRKSADVICRQLGYIAAISHSGILYHILHFLNVSMTSY